LKNVHAHRRKDMVRVSVALVAVCVGLSLSVPAVHAGEEPAPGWHKELAANLNLTQASFDNWAEGGENMLGWQAGLDGKFTHLGVRHDWTNGVHLSYGMQKVGDQEARKSVDEIKIGTVYTYKAGFFVDPYAAATAETQFGKGYKYEDGGVVKTAVSDFLDPGYFTESVGVGRSYRDILESRLGFALKETISKDYGYADDPETENKIEKTRVEPGMESVTDLSLKLSESLLFTSTLGLFSNLEATNEIDVAWDNLLAAKVHEYVVVGLNFHLLYDRDVSKQRQIRQSLAIGLTYAIM
jgi:hypothetical protein